MSSPAPVEHDVVVIGGGHNGLVAANYLADTGLDVCVVEAAADIGGFTATGPVIPAAPDHLINSYSVDAFFWDAFFPASCTLSTCPAYLLCVFLSTRSPAFSIATSTLSAFLDARSLILSRNPMPPP